MNYVINNILLPGLVGALIGWVLARYRYSLISRYRQRARHYIFKQDDWRMLHYQYLCKRPYFRMFIDLRYWTYKQMFKGLE